MNIKTVIFIFAIILDAASRAFAGTLPNQTLTTLRTSQGLVKMHDGVVDTFHNTNGIDETASSNYDFADETVLLLHFDGDDADTSTDDSSAYGHIVTLYGAQISIDESKFGGSSLEFDGVDDYATVDQSRFFELMRTALDDVTIDFWIKFTSTVFDPFSILHYHSASDTRWLFDHSDHPTGGGWEGSLFPASTNESIRLNRGAPAGALLNTDWHHVAIIKVGNEYAVYVNGAQSNYVQDGDEYNIGASATLDIGRDPYYSNHYFKGFLDEFRFVRSNVFNAAPNSAKTDMIIEPTAAHGASFSGKKSLSPTAGTNMTVISQDFDAEDEVSKISMVVFHEPIESTTLNTDLKLYVRSQTSESWTQLTLTDEGLYDRNRRILLAESTSDVFDGTDIQYKLISANNKTMKIHGVGVWWE